MSVRWRRDIAARICSTGIRLGPLVSDIDTPCRGSIRRLLVDLAVVAARWVQTMHGEVIPRRADHALPRVRFIG
jgi:hypothetical protein